MSLFGRSRDKKVVATNGENSDQAEDVVNEVTQRQTFDEHSSLNEEVETVINDDSSSNSLAESRAENLADFVEKNETSTAKENFAICDLENHKEEKQSTTICRHNLEFEENIASDTIISRDQKKVERPLCLEPEQIQRFLETLSRYGCLSDVYWNKTLPSNEDLPHPLSESIHIENLDCGSLYFHTKESVKIYENLTDGQKFSSHLFVGSSQDIQNLSLQNVYSEVSILTAFEKACQASKSFEFYDWLSEHNPRKKRLLKIRRSYGKRGSLTPLFLLTLKKADQKFALLFDQIPSSQSLTIGERRDQACDIIFAYNAWLTSKEKVKQWLNKRRVPITPDSIAVMFFFDDKEEYMAKELEEECRDRKIETPIYFSSWSRICKTPFHSWFGHANFPKTIPLKKKSK